MTLEFSTQTIRELKGCPLSVFLVLTLTTVAVNQEWIERATGYTDKPVSQALAYLQETGRVTKTKAGWQIAAGVQLPLPAPSDESESRKVSDSDAPIIIVNTDSKDLLESLNNNTSRKLSDSSKIDDFGGKTQAQWDAIWEEFGQGSVYRNDRTEELARQPHITPEFIRAHRLRAKADDQGGPRWAGLLITKLEQNMPAPELNKNGHLADCKCDACRRLNTIAILDQFCGTNVSAETEPA